MGGCCGSGGGGAGVADGGLVAFGLEGGGCAAEGAEFGGRGHCWCGVGVLGRAAWHAGVWWFCSRCDM